MANLSLNLSSWMMVSTLLCLLLLLCFSVPAQVNKTVVHAAGTKDSSITRIVSKDSVLHEADSLLRTRVINQPQSLISSLKQTAQQAKKILHDTLPAGKQISGVKLKGYLGTVKMDTIRSVADTSIKRFSKSAQNALTSKVKKAKEGLSGLFDFLKKGRPDSLLKGAKLSALPLPPATPLVHFGGGYINYAYNYRSATDTPFAEKNIGQHNITGTTGVMLANILPVNINFWIRRSNSILFRDITDIQVSFDPAAFRNRLVDNLRRKMLAFLPSFNDSLLKSLENIKSNELSKTKSWLQTPFNVQRLREYRELLGIHALHPENMPTDSLARLKKELQLKEAAVFIKLYDSTRLQYDTLTRLTDSLKNQLASQRRKLAQYRQVLNGRFSGWSSYTNWRDDLNKYDPGGLNVPDKYKWLMGIRNFSLGKTPVNYSELTAKNMSLSGINFEYNSWYYLAVAAGAIDYRFRDFVVGSANRSPQYLVMLRAGIGRIEKNYFIVSLFKGQKQLYSLPATGNMPNTINVTGITAETKWQVNAHTYIIAEAGESASPDYRSTPPVQNGKFTLQGNLNKALSVKFYSVFPGIGARAEGMYKYTGANYQSFSTFQSNAAINTWYLKWEQSFFKRQLKLTGSLRSNEFTNPYIVQNYKSNTVFKSISAVFRVRKWPLITVGYMPMSQLSVVGQQVVENRFQTLTASISHFYKIGSRQVFTSFIYNKFYNTSADSGFVYFNASNFYLSQNIVFRLFTAGVGIADSKSSQYHLTSGEITIQVPLLKKTVCGMALKINHFNQTETKTGGKFNIDVNITHRDRIGVNYEKTWLPGTGRQLVNSDIGNILYSRYF